MPKGIYKRTKEHIEKVRQALLGRKLSPEAIEKNRQGHLGKRCSSETIKKMRQAQQKRRKDPKDIEKSRSKTIKYYKENPMSEEQKNKIKQSQIERYKDKELIERCRQLAIKRFKNSNIKEKMSKSQQKRFQDPREREKSRLGQLHLFSALDHLVKDKYCRLFTPKLREEVRIRDGYICQNCGKKQKDLNGFHKRLTVHHIHYDKSNCYPDLICLCNKCNLLANTRRSYWESYFMNKLNERELLFWTKNRNK